MLTLPVSERSENANRMFIQSYLVFNNVSTQKKKYIYVFIERFIGNILVGCSSNVNVFKCYL